MHPRPTTTIGPQRLVFIELTLLFIHGAGSNSLVWHLQLKRFKDAAFAVQLPGHTVGPGCSSIEDYATAVESQIKENHVENLIPVGHSMGGAIAIELALRRTDLAGLILVGTGARLSVHSNILRKIHEDYPEACKLVAQWSVAPGTDSAIMGSIANEMLKANPEVSLCDFMACDKFDRTQSLERIRCPTRIICGSEDQLTPVKYSKYLHERIRNSSLVLIPGAGHSVMLEKHREFNDAIAAFLGSL
jgi:pimeloyl-ACP methyl ester carboxylesterase